MDPLSLAIFAGLALLGAAAGIAIVTIILLTIGYLLDWFDDYTQTNTIDEDEVGFALKKGIEEGKVTYVQGVFNKNTSKIAAARTFAAESTAKDVDEMFGNKEIAIFT